jgi:hypothetical protein
MSPRQSQDTQKTELVLKRVEIKVPMAEAGEAGLQTVLVFPSTPGRHPLVLMTHGSSYSRGTNQQMGPGLMQPQAVWFARRGYIVAIVARRGYGASGGKMDKTHYGCDEASFAAIAEENAADLTAVFNTVKHLRAGRRRQCDCNRQFRRRVRRAGLRCARPDCAQGGHQFLGRVAFDVLCWKLREKRTHTRVFQPWSGHACADPLALRKER